MIDQSDIQALRSYCSVCDALPGECQHSAHRYLDEIVYKRSKEGWACPNEAEKHRFWNPPKLEFAERTTRAGIEPKPIQQIVVELEAWMLLGESLESELRRAHEQNPRKVTMIAEHVASDASSGRLRNPAGLLVSMLRDMQ